MAHQTPINTAEIDTFPAKGTYKQVQIEVPCVTVNKSEPTTNKAW